MLELVSSKEMKEIEQKTFALGARSVDVMEKAAEAVADFINLRFDKDTEICVVCGKGNNGGDGYAAARILHGGGYDVCIYNVFDAPQTEDAKTNFDEAKSLDIPFVKRIDADVVIDAVLGIGINGACSLDIIDEINESGAYVLAVDVPTGVDADTGMAFGKAVRADATLAFGYVKTGLLQYPAKTLAGEIVLAPLDFAPTDIKCFYPDEEDIADMIPDMAMDEHKGSMGRLCIIAGSKGMTGAATLSAMGALRAGAGLVSVVIPDNLNTIMEIKLTEAMTVSAPCVDSLTFDAAKKAIDSVAADAYVIGPGLGRGKDIYKIVEYVLKKDVPVVIDADGINAICGNIDILKQFGKKAILTPHPGEAARLLGLDIEKVQSSRINLAKTFSKEYNTTMVLKGAGTVTAATGGNTYINPTGNPGMATGGSGDVLSGIIGAFAARGMSAEYAAAAGVYVHGLAGDIAARQIGQIGMIPTDMAKCVAEAIQRIKNPEH
ncbi:MAG: NAD(P)H-hydrate dehydratase [Clostridia bacterium]|nr:NAD(P)H-hydrate dehydratase [Clostridia bacterium]